MNNIILYFLMLLVIDSVSAADYVLPVGEYNMSFNLDVSSQPTKISIGGILPPNTPISNLDGNEMLPSMNAVASFSNMSLQTAEGGYLDIFYFKYPSPHDTNIIQVLLNTTLRPAYSEERWSGIVDGHDAEITRKIEQDGRQKYFVTFWIDNYTEFNIKSTYDTKITTTLLETIHIQELM